MTQVLGSYDGAGMRYSGGGTGPFYIEATAWQILE